MIFNLDDIKHIYIAVQYVDFRKAVNGLVAVIEHMFYLSSTDNSLFIFTNKRRTSIKINVIKLRRQYFNRKFISNRYYLLVFHLYKLKKCSIDTTSDKVYNCID